MPAFEWRVFASPCRPKQGQTKTLSRAQIEGRVCKWTPGFAWCDLHRGARDGEICDRSNFAIPPNHPHIEKANAKLRSGPRIYLGNFLRTRRVHLDVNLRKQVMNTD